MVGALITGIPLLLTGSSSSGAFGASHESLSAPDSFAGLTQIAKNPKAPPLMVKQDATNDTTSAKYLSDAYGGAAAIVRTYSDAEISNITVLEAVRAEFPKPYSPYIDPAALESAKPPADVEAFGQVYCVVNYEFEAAGNPEPPDKTYVTTCERTSAHLTVRLRISVGDYWHSPAAAAALTEKAWEKMS